MGRARRPKDTVASTRVTTEQGNVAKSLLGGIDISSATEADWSDKVLNSPPAEKVLVGQIGESYEGRLMQVVDKQDDRIYLHDVESKEILSQPTYTLLLKDENLSFPSIPESQLLRVGENAASALRALLEDGSYDALVEDIGRKYCRVGNWVLCQEEGSEDRAMEFINPAAAKEYTNQRAEEVRVRDAARNFALPETEDDFDQTCCRLAQFLATGEGDALALAKDLEKSAPRRQQFRAGRLARSLQEWKAPLPSVDEPQFTSSVAPLWREVQKLRTSYRSDLLIAKMRKNRKDH